MYQSAKHLTGQTKETLKERGQEVAKENLCPYETSFDARGRSCGEEYATEKSLWIDFQHENGLRTVSSLTWGPRPRHTRPHRRTARARLRTAAAARRHDRLDKWHGASTPPRRMLRCRTTD
jgi:hypothetical protein